MVFPEVFAPLAEELILDPTVGSVLLDAIGSHYEFWGVRSDPYVPALRLAARPPWGEDRVGHLLLGLMAASTQEALDLLHDLRERLPERDHRDADEAIGRVARRVQGEPPSELEKGSPEEVRKVRESLLWRREGR